MSSTSTSTSSDEDSSQSKDLQFDLDLFKDMAVEKLGKGGCTSMVEFGKGEFHRIYLLTMDDGSQYIGRLALPDFHRYKTESEVATMQFVAERTTIRVPKVYAWDADPNNPVGAEYILMEKIPGEPLGDRWEELSLDEKKDIVNQVIEIQLQLFHTTFDRIGSLYKSASNDSYEVGLLVNQELFLGARGKLNLDRGPWDGTKEYLSGLVHSTSDILDDPDAGDEDSYNMDYVDDIRRACELMERVIPGLCPTDAALKRICLQHPDLHLGNIMVEGNKISAIIDWECSGVYPAWDFVECPSFLNGEGYSVSPDEDADEMEGDDLEEYQKVLEETNLRNFYRSEMKRRDQEYGKVMEQAGLLPQCKIQTINLRFLPNDVKRWVEKNNVSVGEK